MRFLTQPVFIPRPIYIWLPLLYFLTGLVLLLVVNHSAGKLAGILLIAFSFYITFKRYSKPKRGTGNRRTRR